jgi:hypothetical protein
MATPLIENNQRFISVGRHPVDNERKIGFIAEAVIYTDIKRREQNEAAKALGEVMLKYPFPPKSCEECFSIIKQIEQEIETKQELLTSGSSNRVAKRYIDAFTKTKSMYEQWAIANSCEKQIIASEEQAYWQQVQSALDQEKQEAAGKKGVDNWIVFGVLGILAAGALIIIFKA